MFKIHFFFVPVKVFRGRHSVVAASPEASFSNFQSDSSVKDSTDEIYLLFYRVRISDLTKESEKLRQKYWA